MKCRFNPMKSWAGIFSGIGAVGRVWKGDIGEICGGSGT